MVSLTRISPVTRLSTIIIHWSIIIIRILDIDTYLEHNTFFSIPSQSNKLSYLSPYLNYAIYISLIRQRPSVLFLFIINRLFCINELRKIINEFNPRRLSWVNQVKHYFRCMSHFHRDCFVFSPILLKMFQRFN